MSIPPIDVGDFQEEPQRKPGGSSARKALEPGGQGPENPWEKVAPTELMQLGLRAPARDVRKFKEIAKQNNFSQPQLLRILLRAFEDHPNKEQLGKEVIRSFH